MRNTHHVPRVVKHQVDSACHKMALELADGFTIETAFHHPQWLCVSCQVGCPLRCGFCETGAHGLSRNLTADEILLQWSTAIGLSQPPGPETARDFETISFSGMGEPLLNLEAVRPAMTHLHALTSSRLHISTVGILPHLADLFAISAPFSLDISLHATRDETRQSLIPINARYPLRAVLKSVFDLNQTRGALVTICYMLLDGVNDSDQDLARLIALVAGHRACVELKVYNPVASSTFRASPTERFTTFKLALLAAGIPAYIFGNEGQRINAGCGQLVWGR